MLKRPRALSPSPTRADPYSPPPLDHHPRLSLPKRRRIVGPLIDGNERRDGVSEDDGEDDYDFEYEDDTIEVPTPVEKVYEHVNHFLHSLHAEHQWRARATQSHSTLSPGQHVPQTPGFTSPRGLPPPLGSPLSSLAKHDRDFKPTSAHMSSIRHHACAETREGGEHIHEESNNVCDTRCEADNNEVCGLDDERIRVTLRYENTNRLLGSVVRSRRRTLRSPSVDLE